MEKPTMQELIENALRNKPTYIIGEVRGDGLKDMMKSIETERGRKL